MLGGGANLCQLGVHLQLLGLWIGNISDSLVGACRIGNWTRERFFGVPLIVNFRRVSRTMYSNSSFIRVLTGILVWSAFLELLFDGVRRLLFQFSSTILFFAAVRIVFWFDFCSILCNKPVHLRNRSFTVYVRFLFFTKPLNYKLDWTTDILRMVYSFDET